MAPLPPIPPCPVVVHTPWHLSIGMFIGILGFLGAAVPLIRGDKLGRLEKALWTALLALLLVFEIRSIHLDEVQHDREQRHAECENQRRFQESMRESQQQFAETMLRVDEVFQKTESAAEAAQAASIEAKEGVASLTGADSYIFISPQTGFVTANSDDKDAIWLMVTVHGKHTVWDAHVEMSDAPNTVENLRSGKMPARYSLGNVSNTYWTPLTTAPLRLDKSKESSLYFASDSRGSFVRQMLTFRYETSRSKWQYKDVVWEGPKSMNVIKRTKWQDVPKVRYFPLKAP